ncbi:MAG TPA: RagB/SusD family nutrient uptake outer membrane protein [Bacteroidales bacterium]|nr:RagB/SusD family nutrient uptake outer membrane protein [Bacteroidales bacterium]
MRIRAKYFLIILLVFSQISCTKWLDILPPNGLVRDEFWKVKEDVEAVLMSAYETFSSMDRTLFLQGELRADMLQGGVNQSSDEQNIMENNIYPDNPYCDWSKFYLVIDYCNEVIKNAPQVQKIDDTFTDFQLKSLVAEAYYLRSLTYFYLVRIYGDVPLVLEPSETDNADFYLPKTPGKEVLNQIVSDLQANYQFAPSGGFSTIAENKGRASKAAYDALLADIELWRFNYEDVLKYVQRIEKNDEFKLLPSSRWFELFYPGNSLESIFELQFDENLNQSNNTYNLTRRANQQYTPSQKAIQMFGFEYSNEIVRGQDATIAKYGDNDFAIWKYVGQAADGQSVRSGDNQLSANWIIYRFADVMLMKAEALSQLQRFDESLAIINKIRDRAGVSMLSVANNTVAFEDAILEERARELAYEGKRWFDLLRLGRRNNYARKDKLIEIIVSNASSTQKRVLAARLTNPLGWYLPVYATEIERNKNLEQNPYYNF